MNLNKAMIIGNLTRDPEVRNTPTGLNVATFSVATNQVWKDQSGQKQEKAEFHNVVVWRRLAEICGQYLRKGSKIYIEGRTQGHQWELAEAYYKEFEHPLWADESIRKIGTGHGGMDYLEDLRLIQALQKGRYPDMDVYDAAAWSAVSQLSELSIAGGSKPMKFPDFTRGRWKTNKPIAVVEI